MGPTLLEQILIAECCNRARKDLRCAPNGNGRRLSAKNFAPHGQLLDAFSADRVPELRRCWHFDSAALCDFHFRLNDVL
jgi:hypothetical protein